jgi:Xaa-Pro dipeptidase
VVYAARHARLAQALAAAGLDGLILNAGPSLTYLTGLHFHLSERPIAAIFQPGAPVYLALPELEAAKVSAAPLQITPFHYGEDPAGLPAVFRQALRAAELGEGRVAVEPTRLRFLELRLLEAAAPQAQLTSGAELLAALRMSKDDQELQAMRRAVEIAQAAFQATLHLIQPGMTERQLAAALTMQLYQHGSDPEMPFTPIVASGPNSANPHAVPTDRRLASGDLLILDWGASYLGYFSDLTRTLAIGPAETEYQKIAAIVLQANAAARQRAAAGVTAGEVDRAARQVIEQAGYGAYFTHRVGHGLGMEGHEPPYLFAGNPLPLAPGMTFTIEPGIYLPGRGGVRIEDNCMITAQGCESLSSLPRQLFQVG